MKLEVAVEDISQCVKDLSVEIPADAVKAEYEKAYDAYQRYVKVPGFRPGRVPRGVVKQRFGKELKDEVVKQLLPHALEHAIRDQKLHVVSEPALLDCTVSEGEPMKFKVSVEVLPEFELKEYKGLKATKRVRLVSEEEDVEKTLQSWRERATQLVPVEDRPSQMGDVVAVNLAGKYIEPPEAEDLKAEDVLVELGAAGTHEAFNENLSGVKAGDVREFRVAYPEDFTSSGLAGKTLDFTATVTAVRRKEVPDLDDDFARAFSEFGTLAEMRDGVREMLSRNQMQSAGVALRNDLLGQILQGYDFEVPPSIVEHQAQENAREFAYMLMHNGLSPEAIKSWDWDEHIKNERQRVVPQLRGTMIASKIAQAEGISVSQDEVDAEIARLADSTGEPFAQLKARLTKEESLSSIESRLLYQKALDVIVNNAEITVEEVTSEQEAERIKAEANDRESGSATILMPADSMIAS
ncbi:MAG: trigger factor [Blastocatellia bacterium]